MPTLRPLTASSLLLVSSLLAACAGHRQQPLPVTTAVPPSLTASYAAAARAGAGVYRLDAPASTVWIRVGKAGPLAALGHRHVISVGRLYGFARLDATGTGQADLRFPVAALAVDTAAAEKRYHHYSRPTAKDIAGTRAHMLGSGVLDRVHYPWVSLHIHATLGKTSRVLTATITLHGIQRTLEIANHFTHSGSHLSAQGEFSIKQSNFNITPYAILLGALQVKDTIRIRYHLVFNVWCPNLPPAKAPTC